MIMLLEALTSQHQVQIDFKITLTLVKKILTDPNSADFIELLRTNAGKLEKKVERSELGFINDILATRTKEESGIITLRNLSLT